MAKVQLLWTFVTLWPCHIGFVSGGVNVSNVSASEGTTVQLLCGVKATATAYWKYQVDARQVPVYVCMDGPKVLPLYKQRFEVDAETFTLTIHNVSVSDSGLYSCADDWNDSPTYFTRLTVTDERTSAQTTSSSSSAAATTTITTSSSSLPPPSSSTPVSRHFPETQEVKSPATSQSSSFSETAIIVVACIAALIVIVVSISSIIVRHSQSRQTIQLLLTPTVSTPIDTPTNPLATAVGLNVAATYTGNDVTDDYLSVQGDYAWSPAQLINCQSKDDLVTTDSVDHINVYDKIPLQT